MKIRAGIEVSSQSDIGCVRQNNEDSFAYWEPEDDRQFPRKGRLAVVADGMGGYAGGQEASRLAVETLVEVYSDFRGDNPQAALFEAMQAANERIWQYSLDHMELMGMGTTCTAAAIVRGTEYEELYYAHVGDSRLYLIRDGHITRVTRDHSYVGRLVELGMISAEQAGQHPHRNLLTSALGTHPELTIDSPEHPLQLHLENVLLICSDGLWGQVGDAEILSAVEDKSAEQAGRELIGLARERGGPDNITVSILRLR
jgi:protein phosphatase